MMGGTADVGGVALEAIQHTFKRVEKKYVFAGARVGALMERFAPFMRADGYGRHTVLNLYYDTEDYALIRRSVERPVYKEKLRLRGYGTPGEENIVFAELKKKYRGVVYKRRIAASPEQVARLLSGRMIPGEDAQIQREILYFLNAYALRPRVFIGYERVGLVGREDPNLRVTFDGNIRWQQDRQTLPGALTGELVLPDDPTVMEIKIAGAAPLWLARLLSEEGLFSTPFSKYGTCYLTHIAPGFMQGGGKIYA